MAGPCRMAPAGGSRWLSCQWRGTVSVPLVYQAGPVKVFLPLPVNESQPGDAGVVFQRLQSLLVTASGVEGFLQRLTELAPSAVEIPVSCGVTSRRDGQPLTVASSDQQASGLDESQYAATDGP